MIKKLIQIDESLCNGCGDCAEACHEGAIAMVDGVAKLLRPDFCDGLGDCLPACPTDAITIITQEAEDPICCHGEEPSEAPPLCHHVKEHTIEPPQTPEHPSAPAVSQLRQWPVQIKLVGVSAPFLQHADLLIAADCTAFAYGNFHQDFIRGRITLVGCPKLDGVDYSEKLTQIFALNPIRSITVTRMQVPCCGGLPFAVERAIAASGKAIPCRVVTMAANGEILQEEVLS